MATRRAALGSDVDGNRLAPSIFNLISGAVWFGEEQDGGNDGGDCGDVVSWQLCFDCAEWSCELAVGGYHRQGCGSHVPVWINGYRKWCAQMAQSHLTESLNSATDDKWRWTRQDSRPPKTRTSERFQAAGEFFVPSWN